MHFSDSNICIDVLKTLLETLLKEKLGPLHHDNEIRWWHINQPWFIWHCLKIFEIWWVSPILSPFFYGVPGCTNISQEEWRKCWVDCHNIFISVITVVSFFMIIIIMVKQLIPLTHYKSLQMSVSSHCYLANINSHENYKWIESSFLCVQANWMKIQPKMKAWFLVLSRNPWSPNNHPSYPMKLWCPHTIAMEASIGITDYSERGV